jgi:hypothetical protein
VNSYLHSRGHFRYLLPNNAPSKKELIFFPFWRLKGMLFSCSPNEIKHRVVDVSHQAIESDLFPMSVGLRSQALKLKFATNEIKGRFLKPTLPINQLTEILDKRFSILFPKPVIHQTYIGETISILYAPYYVEDKIYDAVLNQSISAALAEDFEMSAFKGDRPGGSIRFLPTLCPDCGWDLKGQRDSLVLNCENCSSVWKALKEGFTKLSVSHLPDNDENLVYMPFWRIKVKIEGIALESYADLIRAANLPKAVQNGMENIRFHFWALGFKVRPESFLKLARMITLSQPGQRLSPGAPKAKKHPVTLPLREAVDSLKMTLASFLKPRKKMMETLPDIIITPKSFILVYLPFQERQHELVQPKFTMAINKNLLAHARNL